MNRWISALLVLALVPACGPRQGAGNSTVFVDPIVSNSGSGAVAVEGAIDSGGGRGVLCQKDKQTVESLDLVEARDVHGLTIDKQLNSEAETLEFLADTLANYFWTPDSKMPVQELRKKLSEDLNLKYKKIEFLEKGKTLKMIDDSHDVIVGENCKVVQLAIFYNESSLIIDKALWEKMSWTDRAALLAHEAIYFAARQIGAKNSVETRKLVGHIFSSEGIASRSQGIPEDNKKYSICEFRQDKGKVPVGKGYAYEIIKDGKPGVELVLTKIGPVQSIFRLSAFLPERTIPELVKSRMDQSAKLVIETYPPTHVLHFSRQLNKKGELERKGELSLTNSKTARAHKYKFVCLLPGNSAFEQVGPDQVATQPEPGTQLEFNFEEGHPTAKPVDQPDPKVKPEGQLELGL